MRLTGFLLLLAGWGIDLAAVMLLRAAPRTVFVLAGTGVQVLGFILAARSHLIPRPELRVEPREEPQEENE
jgi:hypothetical protein